MPGVPLLRARHTHAVADAAHCRGLPDLTWLCATAPSSAAAGWKTREAHMTQRRTWGARRASQHATGYCHLSRMHHMLLRRAARGTPRKTFLPTAGVRCTVSSIKQHLMLLGPLCSLHCGILVYMSQEEESHDNIHAHHCAAPPSPPPSSFCGTMAARRAPVVYLGQWHAWPVRPTSLCWRHQFSKS